jgi:hypothetical protein
MFDLGLYESEPDRFFFFMPIKEYALLGVCMG